MYICNNGEAASFRATITPEDGEVEEITKEISSVPWLYYLDVSDIAGNYNLQFDFFTIANDKIE